MIHATETGKPAVWASLARVRLYLFYALDTFHYPEKENATLGNNTANRNDLSPPQRLKGVFRAERFR